MNNFTDIERIKFLLSRDTKEEVMHFAKQCVRVYRGACLSGTRKFGKRHTFRIAYIASYLFHKRYVLNNGLEGL